MLVDPKSQARPHTGAEPVRAPSRGDDPARAPAPPPYRSGVGFLVLLIAIVAVVAWRMFGDPFGRATIASVPAEKPASLIRTANRVSVPEGSPVRSRIAIAPVDEREFRRDLVLPAVVEADPARLIKVLPPLSGRVNKLMIQLGERVTSGQPLVVLDSPDLGTAYADYDRAKAQLALTLKNRDRQRALIRIGGAAPIRTPNRPSPTTCRPRPRCGAPRRGWCRSASMPTAPPSRAPRP